MIPTKTLMNKKLILKIVSIALVIIAACSLTAYAATQLIGNPVDLTPVDKPTLSLSVNNASPFVGDPAVFTAEMKGSGNVGQTINFKMANGTSIGTAVTGSDGKASLSYIAVSTEHLVIKPYATI